MGRSDDDAGGDPAPSPGDRGTTAAAAPGGDRSLLRGALFRGACADSRNSTGHNPVRHATRSQQPAEADRLPRPAVTSRLVGAVTPQHGRDHSQEDAQVERQRLILNVFEIEFDPPLEREPRATRDLPQANDPWLHQEATPLLISVTLDLTGQVRAWAHQAQLPAQHVEQLRQFIQRGLPQPPPNPSDARIVAYLEDRSARLVLGGQPIFESLRIPDHAPELEKAEGPSVLPDAHLREENRPTVLEGN